MPREQWWGNLLFCPAGENEFREIDEPRRPIQINRQPPLHIAILEKQEWMWKHGSGSIRFAFFDQPAESEFVLWFSGRAYTDRLDVIDGAVIALTPASQQRSVSTGANPEEAKRYGL